jgi:DNA-binding response OmpR family regulator
MPERSPILLLDDNPTDRFFVRSALEQGRVLNAVIECATADEARRQLRSSPSVTPVLCILDINLRGSETGIEWLRWLRQQPGTFSTIPTIILTGSDDAGDRAAGSDLSALRYLQKPIAIEELLEVVNALGLVIVTNAESGEIEFSTA